MRLPDSVSVLIEPRDAWVGVHWTREWVGVAKYEAYEMLTVYVCLLPFLPIRMIWAWNARHDDPRIKRCTRCGQ